MTGPGVTGPLCHDAGRLDVTGAIDLIYRAPVPQLQPYVAAVWSTDAGIAPAVSRRELALPAGTHHIVIRLGRRPLRLFRSAEDAEAQVLASAVIAGMRTQAVCKATDSMGSVGAILRADALGLARGFSAAELTGRYTPLADAGQHLCMDEWVGQVEAGATPAERLACFEQALLRLFEGAGRPDPVIRSALRALGSGARVGSVADSSGMSHRHFCARFRDVVGLPPGKYRQVRRFGRLLDALSAQDRAPLAAMAFELGFADQAHMTREFRTFTGLTITRYDRIAMKHRRHVPLPA